MSLGGVAAALAPLRPAHAPFIVGVTGSVAQHPAPIQPETDSTNTGQSVG